MSVCYFYNKISIINDKVCWRIKHNNTEHKNDKKVTLRPMTWDADRCFWLFIIS